ncbi:MAG: S1 RNA-binding domain-containing protein [Anaerolineae bacterium]|nr:MAG: S1 RNA-binding domain-containing protein [Anaerolineae bacterium]
MTESEARVAENLVEEEITEVSEPQPSMEELLDEQGLEIEFPRPGEIREGVIAAITDNEIMVSIGAKSEGVISGRELDQIDPETRAGFKVGDTINVFVLSADDQNGNLAVSYTRAREAEDWDMVERLKESGETYQGVIAGFNKGGLLVPVGQLRGFVPGSQVSLLRRTAGDTPEKRWGKLVGEPIEVAVVEVDRERRRLILSERKALSETREVLKERLLDELSVGDVVTGRVTSLASFGAFVNIDGADGLVHLSEISWERIKHPKDVLKVGQEVQVKVISLDPERKRIGLSIRALQENPWLAKVKDLKEGQLVEGVITHLTDFGAFARLEDRDLEGLIHISELSTERVEHPKEVVKVGDKLTLRIINIDREKCRLGLSLRKVSSGAYIDLDWKMVKDEVDAALEAESVAEEPADETAEAAAEDDPAVTPSDEAEVQETA